MRVVASIIFYPMLWARGLALVFLKVVGGLLSLAFLVMLLLKMFANSSTSSGGMSDVPWYGVAAAALPGLCCFMLRQWYDSILLRLNPTGHELYLYQ